MRVAIVGAGVAGLAIGWRLAQAGVETHVFDLGTAGAAATWASAGMLTPWQYVRPEPLQRACEEALMLWPGFCDALKAAAGQSIGFAQHGAIRIAQNDIEAQTLKHRIAKMRAQGGAADLLDPIPPFLTPEAKLAVQFPAEAHVDTRALGAALAQAFRNAGGRLNLGERVVRVLTDGRKALGLETQDRRCPCDLVVLAAGAWSGSIEGLPPSVRPPVTPCKGQILALDARGRAAFSGPLIGLNGFYAVPRSDGAIIVGATLEDCGFSTQTDAAAVKAMASWLKDLVLSADEWPILEVWAGLRPGTPDDMPILGASEIEGLFFATGQFRDGILLAPWIADWMSMGVMSAQTPERLRPFSMSRFQLVNKV